MNTKTTGSSGLVLRNLHGLLPGLEALYTELHAHPELSMNEAWTAGPAVDRLRAAGYEVTTGAGAASRCFSRSEDSRGCRMPRPSTRRSLCFVAWLVNSIPRWVMTSVTN